MHLTNETNFDLPLRDLFEKSWHRFSYDPMLAGWVEQTLDAARETLTNPVNREWLRCGGTWFAGVNALPNDGQGAVSGGPPIAGAAVGFVAEHLKPISLAWDRAQISVIYPGYPRPMDAESGSAFRYRLQRDAAHVDGMIPVGPGRRRHLRQYHAFVLGIPLLTASADAAPFVIWEGSHTIIRAQLNALFEQTAPRQWADVDATQAYLAARAEVFATCQRIELSAQPGEAYVVHRHALHGVAPWGTSATAAPDGRMIAYFRPEYASPEDWLYGP